MRNVYQEKSDMSFLLTQVTNALLNTLSSGNQRENQSHNSQICNVPTVKWPTYEVSGKILFKNEEPETKNPTISLAWPERKLKHVVTVSP